MRWTRHDQNTAECSRGNAYPRSHSGTPMSIYAQTNKRDNNSDPCDQYWIPVKRMSSISVVKPGDRKICHCNRQVDKPFRHVTRFFDSITKQVETRLAHTATETLRLHHHDRKTAAPNR